MNNNRIEKANAIYAKELLSPDKRYVELLSKYSGDKELMELLDLVVLDSNRVDEVYYNKYNQYPKRRDNLGKLKIDLISIKAKINSM